MRCNWMLFHIHTPTYIRLCETHSEIEQSLSRMFYAILQKSSFHSEYYCIYVYRLFSPCMWAIFLQLACVRSRTGVKRQREREREGKGKTYFGMRNNGGCHPQSHVCHAAICEDRQRQRGVPRKLIFAIVMGEIV